jgi:sulfatase-like protein
MKSRTLLEGCGAAILILLAYIWPQISPSHVAIYLSVLPTTSITFGILIDILALALIVSCAFALVSRGDAENHHPAWAVFAAMVAAASITSIAKVTEAHRFVPKPGLIATAVLVAAAVCWFWKPWMHRKEVGVFRLGLALVGFSVFWIVPQLLLVGLHHQSPDRPSFRKLVAADPPAGQMRMVWVLFDELSYAQAFESRDPSLSLPTFDRLESQSFSFSHLSPPGYYTAKVVPSLMLGRQVAELRSDLNGRAIIRKEKSPKWEALDPEQTIFAQARRAGWSTGIAGWSNPYCRLLSEVLDSCFWYPDQFTPAYLYSHMSPQHSAIENALAPASNALRRLRHSELREPAAPEFHVRDAEGVIAPAEALIQDEQIGFVFIHLAVPHPPGVFDRRTGEIRNGGSYLDNLALSDIYLAKLLRAIQSTKMADRTILMICSDHSWRTPMWRGASWWTKEDEQASQNGFDSRPVLMVHFPAQRTPTDIAQPMNSLVMHAILSAMLEGKLASEAEFRNWISRYE